MSDDFDHLFGYSVPHARTAPPPIQCGPNLLQEVAWAILEFVFCILVGIAGTAFCFGLAYAVVWALRSLAMLLA